ncbi:MAG TPA: queuosine precursor transporter [Methylomirabilota bacterium]|nr:queuosine precursor transporter [Methylomirabilota bacterium]
MPRHDDLHPIEASVLHARRERVFLVLAGFFLGTLAMLNILGITRFIKLAELTTADGTTLIFAIAIGVLPYPLTFLCTDFISEFYGRRRANFVVFVGLLLNLWVVFVMWLGGVLPGFESVDPATGELVRDAAGRLPVFFELRALTFGAVTASMIAYLAAQLCDVHVFHFWKRVTKGRLLWVRNNGSTMVSQLVDTTAVILITHYYAHALPVDLDQPLARQLALFIATGYAFKFAVAALDTVPFYLGVRWLSRYLEIDPTKEHEFDRESAASEAASP